MSKNNTQFQQNIDIIKNFFRKPIVLVVGIVTILASFASSVVEYLAEYNLSDFIKNYLIPDGSHSFNINGVAVYVNSTSPAVPSPDLLAIALGLSFILLFAFGRSKGNAVQGGATFFRVIANIYYVIYFIVAVCSALMIVFSFAFPTGNVIKLILIASFLVMGIFTFLYGYSLFEFSKSVTGSMKSIYLSDKGAKLHGIMNIISSALCGIIIAVFFICTSIFGGLNSPLVVVGSVAPVALMMANNILWAVVSLGYHRYINGVCSGKIEIPAESKKEDKKIICVNCGCPLTEEDVFCSVCGTKVE